MWDKKGGKMVGVQKQANHNDDEGDEVAADNTAMKRKRPSEDICQKLNRKPVAARSA
jgi:hypothetical protein